LRFNSHLNHKTVEKRLGSLLPRISGGTNRKLVDLSYIDLVLLVTEAVGVLKEVEIKRLIGHLT
jgi:hypothetical protein